MRVHWKFLLAGMVGLVCCGVVLAQGTMPADNVARPEPAYGATRQVLNPKLPTIFIVGDSTAKNGADLGWGDHFAHYFDLTKVNVAHRAIAGRSARSYMNEGAWDKVMAELKPGDYVLLQWGHNDG